MKVDLDRIAGMKVTVMGLGLHGGGVAAARFFSERGASVTVTDLRSEDELSPSISMLNGLPVRYVLGRHDAADFRQADLVIKNPAVPADSPFLSMSPLVESDVSIFLRLSTAPIVAVTGTKGKSTTASAIHAGLLSRHPGARLGGNITVSPLAFLHGASGSGKPSDSEPVVLELSSWQLADLAGKSLLKPVVAVVTNILPDHQNRYPDMASYIRDKKQIYACQDKRDTTILNYDDEEVRRFSRDTGGRVLYFSRQRLPVGVAGAWIEGTAGVIASEETGPPLIPSRTALKGEHNRMNLLAAGLALASLGIDREFIHETLSTFIGIEHRLEPLGIRKGVEFYNDSAATIPEATIAAVSAFNKPVLLIAGGTDKKLDFGVLDGLRGRTKMIFLLPGSATDKMIPVLDANRIAYRGPFGSMRETVDALLLASNAGDIGILSPGCASFGLFANEFDRGRKFKEIVLQLAEQS